MDAACPTICFILVISQWPKVPINRQISRSWANDLDLTSALAIDLNSWPMTQSFFAALQPHVSAFVNMQLASHSNPASTPVADLPEMLIANPPLHQARGQMPNMTTSWLTTSLLR